MSCKLGCAAGYANAGREGDSDTTIAENFAAIEADFSRDRDDTLLKYTCYWYTRRNFALLPIGDSLTDM